MTWLPDVHAFPTWLFLIAAFLGLLWLAIRAVRSHATMSKTPDAVIRSFPDGVAFREFTGRHPRLLPALDDISVGLGGLLELLQEQPGSDANSVLFLLVGACCREFEELVVLALNGYGSGAMKLLRALYERTVTTGYLMQHPGKITQFQKYTAVHWQKLLREADEAGISDGLSAERRKEIETNFINVEDDFTEVVCKEHNKTRLQGSWTKKPVHTQAGELHEQLRQIWFQSYLLPTFFLHTTDWGITKQLEQLPDGGRALHTDKTEHQYATRALIYAATLMTHLADATAKYFKVGDTNRHAIEKAVETITKDLIGMVGSTGVDKG